jgi:hypothetical protein
MMILPKKDVIDDVIQYDIMQRGRGMSSLARSLMLLDKCFERKKTGEARQEPPSYGVGKGSISASPDYSLDKGKLEHELVYQNEYGTVIRGNKEF